MSDLPSPASPSSDPVRKPSRPESEPEERRYLRPWPLALTGLLVGYPLSVGPAVWLSKTLGSGQEITLVLMRIYAPLEYLHRNVPPVHSFYDWYLPFFGVK